MRLDHLLSKDERELMIRVDLQRYSIFRVHKPRVDPRRYRASEITGGGMCGDSETTPRKP